MDAFGEETPALVPLKLPKDPFDLFERLAPSHTDSFLFESLTGPSELAETSVMGFDPPVTITGFSDRMVLRRRDNTTETVMTDSPLEEMRRIVGRNGHDRYRYIGGAVGHVYYDTVRLWEDIGGELERDSPLMKFGIYDDGIIYDHRLGEQFYFYYETDRRAMLGLSGSENATDQKVDTPRISGITPREARPVFADSVNAAKEYIHAGDIFQAVLSRRFDFDIEGSTLPVYRRLREINPSPYMYHVSAGETRIIGASPEMLLRVTGDTLETFPIAGTTKRTGMDERDEILRQKLLQDEKEVAEHTMLVDLGRNDIGRVCRYGTVRVSELMEVKRFSHVQHMVSHVTGRIDPAYDMYDAFRSIFPAGTVSGAPKVRAMQIIDELESYRRGPYAGAVGYFSFNGCCDFAIAIRSIFVDGKKGFVQAGAGIVSDSVAEREFDETQHKADAMISALGDASR